MCLKKIQRYKGHIKYKFGGIKTSVCKTEPSPNMHSQMVYLNLYN